MGATTKLNIRKAASLLLDTIVSARYVRVVDGSLLLVGEKIRSAHANQADIKPRRRDDLLM